MKNHSITGERMRPVRKHRIFKKQRSPDDNVTSYGKSAGEASSGACATDLAHKASANKRKATVTAEQVESKYRLQGRIHDAIRRAHFLKWRQSNPRLPNESCQKWRTRSRRRFARCKPVERAVLAEQVAAAAVEDEEIRGRIRRSLARANKGPQKYPFVDGKGCSLTFHGAWGNFELKELQCKRIASKPTFEDVLTALRRHERLERLGRSAQAYIARRAQSYSLNCYAASLQICTETWTKRCQIQVYMYCWLEHPMNIQVRNAKELQFQGSWPCHAFPLTSAHEAPNMRRLKALTAILNPPKRNNLWESSSVPFSEVLTSSAHWVPVLQAPRKKKVKQCL